MTTDKDRPGASLAEVHILFHGYAKAGDTPSVSRVASTVAFVREGDVRVIIDLGMVPDPASLLESVRALGESPASITDVIFSHHHPDHTLNAALFPSARFHDYWAIYQGDTWTHLGPSFLFPPLAEALIPSHGCKTSDPELFPQGCQPASCLQKADGVRIAQHRRADGRLGEPCSLAQPLKQEGETILG